MASGIQALLNGFAVTFDFEVSYLPARGAINIETKSEGMGSHNKLYIPSDFGIMSWMNSTDSDYPWKDSQGNITTIEINDLKFINGVLRNSDMITVNLESEYYRTYESAFIDLLNVHNVYLHCPNLGHFNSIGVRGGNTITKKAPVSSSLGYLIIDSVVAPHAKTDVSRQLIKTVQFSLRDVYGTVINPHGAAISFPRLRNHWLINYSNFEITVKKEIYIYIYIPFKNGRRRTQRRD